VTHRDFIHVDIQIRTNVPHIFAIWHTVDQPTRVRRAQGDVAASSVFKVQAQDGVPLIGTCACCRGDPIRQVAQQQA